MGSPDIEAIRARAQKAHERVADLCSGKERWTMRVPANFERDSDLILTVALNDIDVLIAEVERMRAEREDMLAIRDDVHGQTAAKLKELLAERERVWDVGRAAQVWRDQFARPTTSKGPRHKALCEAVDAYESPQRSGS